MKKILTLSAIFFFTMIIVFPIKLFAQDIPRNLIKDSLIGWRKIYNYQGVKEPLKIDAKVYSAAQLSICDSFINWMQSSYIPKGGLGDARKAVTPKMGLYDQNNAALPPSYGAYAKTYFFLEYDNNHKLTPANNHNVTWSIMANAVPTGWEIRDISSSNQYYFTMPSYEIAQDAEIIKKQHDLTKIANTKPYISFWVKNVEAGGGTDYVLLCQDNKSPFIKLTKGEYLHILETAIPNVYQKEKKKIYEANKGNQKSIDYFVGYLNEKNEKRIGNLKLTHEKYKDRLGELALVSAQPSINDLETGRDIFSNGYLSDTESTSGRVYVYKIDQAMAELCKKDRPQWILISWWWSANDSVEKHLNESIINNFNFDYVYNFFFDTGKVKGQFYKPVHSPYAKD